MQFSLVGQQISGYHIFCLKALGANQSFCLACALGYFWQQYMIRFKCDKLI